VFCPTHITAGALAPTACRIDAPDYSLILRCYITKQARYGGVVNNIVIAAKLA